MIGDWSRLIPGQLVTGSAPYRTFSVRSLFDTLPGTVESRRAVFIGAVANAIAFSYLLASSPDCILRLVMPLG